MAQELFRLIPNDHRGSDEDMYVVLKKSVEASKEDDVDLLRLRYEVIPLNYIRKEGESKSIVSFTQRATLDAIIDKKEGSVEFSINESNAALPDELQGGGIGSYILSEMIRWAQKVSAELSVVPIRISTPENAGSGREAKLKGFFAQLGFSVINKPGKGVFAAAHSVAHLKTHVNSQKVERVNLVTWGNEWQDSSVKLSNQLKEESLSLNFYKEQANSLKDEKSGKQPFWGGLLVGFVAGLIVGVVVTL